MAGYNPRPWGTAPTESYRQTGGVKPMTIVGRVQWERERLNEMTQEEREWRKKWLKDQELSHREPRFVPEYYKATMNPIRRLYRLPLDFVFKKLEPTLGVERAFWARYWTGKAFIGTAVLLWGWYYFKYNTRTWMTHSGWKVRKSDPIILPGDPRYPKVFEHKPQDYHDLGFQEFAKKNSWAIDKRTGF
ncbi:unnamed protein product [Darwinula stevensoni]|uniref:NADH dehydrogenase [ubiquinone] 1 beta subcomplex subunit 6 n=1 Tax=Darwinula stevensoni TaxID=69355 RepID=A0A7R8WXP4_9CRUS|nr:unnamed protein product [Darwinula stevensoni]CAG0878618.1 unnamed protein product [Darwinula stevensoni]